MKFALFLIVFLVLLQNSIAETTLSQGESTTVNGREIKIISIKENQAIISIDDVKTIINDNEEKEINGVRIRVSEIFYSQELSSIKFIAELTYQCGDNICDVNENSEICCKDCKCEINKKCIENKCKIPECLKDLDCNDNNNLTEDKCSDYKCSFRQIKCKNNNECNDNNADTDDICDKGKCKNIQNYVCKTNEDCNDDNECTLDLCANKDCLYRKVENCKEEERKEEVKEVSKEIKEEIIKEGFFKKLINWFKGIF